MKFQIISKIEIILPLNLQLIYHISFILYWKKRVLGTLCIYGRGTTVDTKLNSMMMIRLLIIHIEI